MSIKENMARLSFGTTLLLKSYKEKVLGDGYLQLTLSQYFYLRAIGNNSEPTPGALADMLGVSRPTVTAMLAKLERLGFLTKKRSTRDKRVFRIILTKKGERISKADHAAYTDLLELLDKRLDDKEKAMLESLMEKMADLALEAAGLNPHDANGIVLPLRERRPG